MELAQPAVDEDDIGVELVAGAGLAVAAADDLADGGVVVVEPARLVGGFDAVAAVLVLERTPVDEADFGADGLAAREVGDIDALDAADGGVDLEDFLEWF